MRFKVAAMCRAHKFLPVKWPSKLSEQGGIVKLGARGKKGPEKKKKKGPDTFLKKMYPAPFFA